MKVTVEGVCFHSQTLQIASCTLISKISTDALVKTKALLEASHV